MHENTIQNLETKKSSLKIAALKKLKIFKSSAAKIQTQLNMARTLGMSDSAQQEIEAQLNKIQGQIKSITVEYQKNVKKIDAEIKRIQNDIKSQIEKTNTAFRTLANRPAEQIPSDDELLAELVDEMRKDEEKKHSSFGSSSSSGNNSRPDSPITGDYDAELAAWAAEMNAQNDEKIVAPTLSHSRPSSPERFKANSTSDGPGQTMTFGNTDTTASKKPTQEKKNSGFLSAVKNTFKKGPGKHV